MTDPLMEQCLRRKIPRCSICKMIHRDEWSEHIKFYGDWNYCNCDHEADHVRFDFRSDSKKSKG